MICVTLIDAQEFIDNYWNYDDLEKAVDDLVKQGNSVAKFCKVNDFGPGGYNGFKDYAESDLIEQLSDEIVSEDNKGSLYHPDYILYDDFLTFVENTLLKYVQHDGYLSKLWC